MSFKTIAKISPRQLEIIDKLKDLDANLKIKWNDKIDAPSLVYGNLSTPHQSVMPESALGFLDGIKELFRMDDPYKELSKMAEASDKAGNVVYAFQQTYKGIPVEGSLVRVHYSAGGTVNRVSNAFVPDIKVATKPAVDDKAAFKSALDDSGPGWQASKRPASLNIVSSEDTWYLIWKVIVDRNERDPLIYYINADDGKVLYRKSGVFHGNGTGFYCGQQDLKTTVGASSKHAGSTHKLVDPTRGYQISIYDLPKPWAERINDSGKVCAYLHLSGMGNNLSEDDDDSWTGEDAGRWEDQRPEVDLAYYFGEVASYFDGLGFKSYDGTGGDIKAAAHDGENFGQQAEYDEINGKFYFGDGDGDTTVLDSRGVPYANPDPQRAATPSDGKGMNFLTSKDIIAHEYTHAMICHTANFDKCPEGLQGVSGHCPRLVPCPSRAQNKFRYDRCGQSFTLHEAVADIFAYLITGEPDMGKGVIIDPVCRCIRTLNDPADKQRNDIYKKHSNHMRSGLDSLGKGYITCHDVSLDLPFDPQINMGPVAYAGYLMAHGGTHPESHVYVEGIGGDEDTGRKITAQLAYHALSIGLLGQLSRATFLDFREAMLGAVEDLFRNDARCMAIRNSVISAFNAVGIGDLIITPKPLILYERRLIKWPPRRPEPDPRRYIDPRAVWPIAKATQEIDALQVHIKDYGDSPGVITLASAPGGTGPIKRARGKDLVRIKLMNTGYEGGGVLVNLFACSPGSMAEPSAWKWVGSSIVEGIEPGEEATAEIAVRDKKVFAGLKSGSDGEVCLIAQIDSSFDRSPSKAEENLKKLKYIDLEDSEFFCSRVKINS